ncbi:unnamed protein product, partial [Mycena citricolor]
FNPLQSKLEGVCEQPIPFRCGQLHSQDGRALHPWQRRAFHLMLLSAECDFEKCCERWDDRITSYTTEYDGPI